MIERGAEFILPGYDSMNALAARFAIPLVLKGTPYGRRVPIGEEAVSQADLEGAFDQLAVGGAADAASAADAIAALDLDPPLSKLIQTRVAISNGHPADDLAASVLDEGASTFGDFDNHTLEGGNMRLAEALAAELGPAVRLSSPVRRVRWSQDAVNIATDHAEIEADAVVVGRAAPPLPRPRRRRAAVRGRRARGRPRPRPSQPFRPWRPAARKLLICPWHMLSRGQVFKPSRPSAAAASSSRFQTA